MKKYTKFNLSVKNAKKWFVDMKSNSSDDVANKVINAAVVITIITQVANVIVAAIQYGFM